jgi:hypothetical protein
MEHAADRGGILGLIEHGWLGVVARESVWLYPAANVVHILALTVFAAAVAMMDARLLGAFRAVAPAVFVGSARPVAVAAFLAMIGTGSVLFAAEATHVAANPVFQAKLVLIGAALLNVLMFEVLFGRSLGGVPPGVALPGIARASAVLSLGLWLSVAAAGRLIAYF